MGTHKDNERIRELLDDWQQLDRLGEESGNISQAEIQRHLTLFKERERERLLKDIAVFLAVAFCILASLVVIVLKAPILFVAIQSGMTVLGPAVLYVLWKRQREGSNLS